MSYITIDDYKNFIGVTSLTPVQEAQINLIIPQTKGMIDSVIWDVSSDTREEKVQFDNVFYERWVTKIYTTKINITEIESINGVTYTWDFKIDWRLGNIIYIDSSFDLSEYPFVELSLTNWYDQLELPSDIKLLQCLMVKDMLSQISGWDIVRKKIGDKELGFSSNTAENIRSLIDTIIKSYSLIHI